MTLKLLFGIYSCIETSWSFSTNIHCRGLLKSLLPWKISLWCYRGKQ